MATRRGVREGELRASPGGRRAFTRYFAAVEAGTTTALLGRSGSGKTTLLRTVNALVRPTSGRVLVGERDVAAADVIALRRGIGYVIQESGLFPQMTVERNVGMALELAGRRRQEIAARAAEMLGWWGWRRIWRGGIRGS